MPYRTWVPIIAFGLIIAGSVFWAVFETGLQIGETRGNYVAKSDSYARHAEQEIRRACLGLDGASQAECIRSVVEATNEQERAQQDLVAQTEMALWAFWVLIVTSVMAVITGVGVVFVWRTLLATQEMAEDTRDIGKDQSRAYVDAAKAHFFWGGKNKASPRVELWVRNVGSTPAKWHEVRMNCFVIPLGDGPLNIPWDELSDTHKIGKWSVLVAGDDRKVTLDLIHHREDIARCFSKTFDRPSHEFYVFGDITYCTFFDEIFTTQFCFGRVGIPDYQASKVEEVGREDIIVYTVSHEVPIHLVRPTCDLDAYNKQDA